MSHHSTTPDAAEKAAILKAAREYKTREHLPLLAHSTLRWARKVRGKFHYFGAIDPALPDYGAGKALAVHHSQINDLRAGRTPRLPDDQADEPTVKVLVDQFLNAKRRLVDTGELTERTWADYHRVGLLLARVFGKHRLVSDLRPEDFAELRNRLSKRLGPVALGNEITRVKVICNYAYNEGLIPAPVRYGSSFRKPSKAVLRKAKAGNGKRLFSAEEIGKLLDACKTPTTRAMILLGINAALGPADIGRMKLDHLDLQAGWLNYPRGKTGIERRIPLWPETVQALRESLAKRPKPKDKANARLVFVTIHGRPFYDASRAANTLVTDAFTAVRKAAGLENGRGHYTLRHVFQTVGDESRDFPAVRSIMGHADASISAEYREEISDERLRAVVDHIHGWLFRKE